MVKQIARAVVGELLETGKQTIKASSQVVTGLPKNASGSMKNKGETEEFIDSLYGVSKGEKKATKALKKGSQEIGQLKDLDKLRSQKRYREIQEELKLVSKKKQHNPRKYITGQTGFDEEQVKDPENYFDKQKKKQEEQKKKQKDLSLKAKKGMGTGEIKVGM